MRLWGTIDSVFLQDYAQAGTTALEYLEHDDQSPPKPIWTWTSSKSSKFAFEIGYLPTYELRYPDR